MAERDRHEHGTFSWTDLSTPDAEASQAFYGRLFDWQFKGDLVPGGGVYVMARLGGRAAAAMFETTERHPAWASYVTVDGADAITARARELGANVLAEPFDVMDRMATLQDPTGAVFCVWQPRKSIGAEVVNGPGALSLNQLNTSDPEAAQRFYTELFGWRFDAVQGGPGPYFAIYRGEATNGGMMPLPSGQPAPSHWLVYFGIDDIEEARQQIDSSGGQVLVPKLDVPGGQILVAQDPQGGSSPWSQGGSTISRPPSPPRRGAARANQSAPQSLRSGPGRGRREPLAAELCR
jgi:predicted enzyme related to lactoylglutathione lyase